MASPKEILKAYKKTLTKEKKKVIDNVVNKDPFSAFLGCMSQAIVFEKQEREHKAKQQLILKEQTKLNEQKDKESTKRHLESIISVMAESLKKEAINKDSNPELLINEATEETTTSSQLTSDNISYTQEEDAKEEDAIVPPENEKNTPTTSNNPYVSELTKGSKVSSETEPEDIKKLKGLVSTQLQAEINKIREIFPNLGMSSGTGGGTNAVQFAEGGTMHGNLNVTGKYLSGGIELSELFNATGGGGPTNKLISGSQTATLSSNGVLLFNVTDDNIVLTTPLGYKWTFDNNGVFKGPANTVVVESLDTNSHLLSAGVNLSDLFASKDIIDGGTFA